MTAVRAPVVWLSAIYVVARWATVVLGGLHAWVDVVYVPTVTVWAVVMFRVGRTWISQMFLLGVLALLMCVEFLTLLLVRHAGNVPEWLRWLDPWTQMQLHGDVFVPMSAGRVKVEIVSLVALFCVWLAFSAAVRS